MENTNKQLLWKIMVPLTALLLATFFVLNTAGFNSILKLFGIKASDNDLIVISSTSDFLGTNPDAEWLVEATRPLTGGTVVVESYSTLPNDPETVGMIIPAYSSRNEDENVYKTHTYISPVIDLKKAAPYLNSISAKYFEMSGATINFAYRMDDAWENVAFTDYTPLELTQNSSLDNLSDRTALLSQEGKRYLQFKIEFEGTTFDSRAAVYEIRIDTKRGVDENAQFVQMPDASEIMNRNFKLTIPTSITSPTSVDVLLLSAANQGKVPVHALYNQTLTSLAETGFDVLMAGGAHALVVKAAGFETQVVPLDLRGETVITLDLEPLEKSITSQDFDLNGDGAINSIDLQVLLGKFGPVSP